VKRRRRLYRDRIQRHTFKASVRKSPACLFLHDPWYVAHHIGSATYGTYFALKLRDGLFHKSLRSRPGQHLRHVEHQLPGDRQDLEYLDTNQVALV